MNTQRIIALSAALGLALALAPGCQSPPVETGAERTTPSPRDVAQREAEQRAAAQQKADLLEDAAAALADDRLLTPIGTAAYDHYRAVLAVDPDDAAALRGLDTLVERYLERAAQALERGDYAGARASLEHAEFVNETHAGIAALAQQIDLLEHAKRQRFVLDAAGLAAEDAAVRARLREIGTRAKQPATRAVITARSDAQGRWIYQQMSEAPGDRRITAELQIGAPSSIVILELDPDLVADRNEAE